ncbi:uncharacterized protein P884DRAFT_260695 [Thermothelomyces heterothallicus CBS 202.75]|uniref:uncharacterized protein n=1 Tax=Thermothelomyces heterothallicus CBS 202.75 TaxID=1149848 RepID=UPI00374499F6
MFSASLLFFLLLLPSTRAGRRSHMRGGVKGFGCPQKHVVFSIDARIREAADVWSLNGCHSRSVKFVRLMPQFLFQQTKLRHELFGTVEVQVAVRSADSGCTTVGDLSK